MSLENEINRLKRAKSNIRASLKTKIGLDIPEETTLDKYAECINNVESTCPHINGDFYSLRTNNGTNYSYLFENYNGTNLDYISNWDTSKVTSMERMFCNCNFTSLDLSNWDTSQVTTMSSMFQNCSSLISIDLSHLDTSKVTDMRNMFGSCKFTSLDLSGWNTSNVTDMNNMFQYCEKLVTLDLSGWDTSKVISMNYMFYSNYGMALTHIFGELDLSNLTYGFYPGSSNHPLRNCVNLETLYLKNIYKYCTMTNASKWSINLGDTNVKDECLTYIIDQLPDLINDKKLTTTTNIILTLPKTNLLSEEQVAVATNKGWQVANTTYNLASYNVVYNLENVTCEEKLIAKEGMPFKLALFAEDNYYITSVVVTMGDKTITPTYNKDSDGFTTSANINITSVTGDINIVAVAKEIIARCSSFTVGVADPSKNNTLSITPISNDSVKNILINGKQQTLPTSTYTKSYTVKDGDKIEISGTFNLTDSTLTSITNFELQSSATSMYKMFDGSSNLTSISFSDKFYTSNVTNMSRVFADCNKLTQLDVSKFVTSRVTNMNRMFYACNKLTSLNLVNWNTEKVTDMGWMFALCGNLTLLDLSNFDTRNVTSYDKMLYFVPSTCTIYINPVTFINKKTGKTFTPSELSWTGTFTDCTVINPILPPTYPTDPENPFLPPA